MTQETASLILKNGYNVYLTGSAGTGKTYLINEYIAYLRHREVAVAVTASTGIAATHIGGQTIHSWSGLGIQDQASKEVLDRIKKNKQTVSRLSKVSVLIIDEISMLSGKMLTAVSDVLKHFRKSELPFGGIQVVLSGDFFQLPPVSREQRSNRDKFAFMAPIWVESRLRVCYLTQQFRQKESTLSQILSEIRDQSVTQETALLLQDKMKERPDEDALKLYTHNADVDNLNTSRLEQAAGKPRRFEAETYGKGKLVESLKQTVLAGPELELKPDAKVMFVRNNPERGYFNGTLGVVTDFDSNDGHPIVTTTDGLRIMAKPEEWTVTDEKDNVLAAYRQVPLRLAWAITIHKSQGMTLDAAEIDLSKTFEAGQGYVALSRLRDWEGLSLTGINEASLLVDTLALKADRRFQELAAENEQWITGQEKEELAIKNLDFIEKCGGTNDPEKIEYNQSKEKPTSRPKKKEDTVLATRKLFDKGKTIDEVAHVRDLTEGTIIGHLEKIMAMDPDFKIDRFRPHEKTISKVGKVAAQAKKEAKEEFFDREGRVKLSVLHRALKGSLDYESIRLARLFLDGDS